MTYHDKLLGANALKRFRLGNARIGATLRGINEMTLWPSKVDAKVGSVADDWRAVGADIAKAMRHFHIED